MSNIKFNKELMTALEGCKDAKEVVALAKANGVTLSEEKAERICEILNSEELTDEELDMVVGGEKNHNCPCDKEDYDQIKKIRNPS